MSFGVRNKRRKSRSNIFIFRTKYASKNVDSGPNILLMDGRISFHKLTITMSASEAQKRLFSFEKFLIICPTTVIKWEAQLKKGAISNVFNHWVSKVRRDFNIFALFFEKSLKYVKFLEMCIICFFRQNCPNYVKTYVICFYIDFSSLLMTEYTYCVTQYGFNP